MGTQVGNSLFLHFTTAANGKVARIHDRMPVIITPDFYNRWLDKKHDCRNGGFFSR